MKEPIHVVVVAIHALDLSLMLGRVHAALAILLCLAQVHPVRRD